MAKAPQTISAPALIVHHRGLLTAALMIATVMQVLDTTIANVALPHMAASLNASQNEINWILTSYIVASAIANARVKADAAGEYLDEQDLYVKNAFVDEGTTLKRFQPRAQGRAFQIKKRTSHITVVLATPELAEAGSQSKKASK